VRGPARFTGTAAHKNDEEAAMSESTRRRSRRHFLLSVGVGGVATAAAISLKNSPTAPHVSTGSGKRTSRGYQASEHVHRYYRTTKV
jgi:ferric-dicitrate binding protein FerR (iron transport regulator)